MIDHEPPVKRAVVKFEPGADLTAFPAYEEAKAMESRPLEDDDRAPSDAGAGGIDAGEPTSDRLARSPALESLDPRSPTYLYDLLESAIFAEDDGGDRTSGRWGSAPYGCTGWTSRPSPRSSRSTSAPARPAT